MCTSISIQDLLQKIQSILLWLMDGCVVHGEVSRDTTGGVICASDVDFYKFSYLHCMFGLSFSLLFLLGAASNLESIFR